MSEAKSMDEQRETVAEERREEPSYVHRTTEQGDELTELPSLSQREGRPKLPYRPPRQPAQDPPAAG
jgi:hypothetical protein